MTPNETSPDQAVEAVARVLRGEPWCIAEYRGFDTEGIARAAIAAIPTPLPSPAGGVGPLGDAIGKALPFMQHDRGCLAESCDCGVVEAKDTLRLSAIPTPPPNPTDLIARIEGAKEVAMANIDRIPNSGGPNFYFTRVVGWSISGPTAEDVADKVRDWFASQAADALQAPREVGACSECGGNGYSRGIRPPQEMLGEYDYACEACVGSGKARSALELG